MALHVIGLKTVTTAGTRVQLSTTRVAASWISFQASDGNSGKVYIGDSLVSSVLYAASLPASGAFYLPNMATPVGYNLADIWIDASANSQTVQVAYGGQ